MSLLLEMASSSLSSASKTTRTSAGPLCECELQATLRYSNTTKNPGRPFLGCSKYNTQGLPYCKYFKWVDSDECIEMGLEVREKVLERKEKEVQRRLADIDNMEIEFRKRAAEIENREMVQSRRDEAILKREMIQSSRDEANLKREMVQSCRDEAILKREMVIIEKEARMNCSRNGIRLYWVLVISVFCYLVTYLL